MSRLARAALLLLVVAAAPCSGREIGVQLGDHSTFGRTVFRVAQDTPVTETQDGDRLTIKLPGGGVVPSLASGARNVRAMRGGTDGASLDLAPGTQVRIWRTRGLIVIDTYGPGPLPASVLGAAPARGLRPPSEAAAPIHATVPPVKAPSIEAKAGLAVAAPAPPRPTPVAAPQAAPPPPSPPGAAIAPNGLAAVRLQGDPTLPDPSILIPFPPEAGAAAFSRSGEAHVVFDDSKPVDLSGLRDDPVFGGARITLLPAAADLHLRLPPAAVLRLKRRPDGWVVSVTQHPPAAEAVAPRVQGGIVFLDTREAGATVVMDDILTGGRLLIGTTHVDGPGVAAAHDSPEFSILPTWQGVLVDPISDRVALHADATGFSIAAAVGPGLVTTVPAGSAQAMSDAGSLTRSFDIPSLPTEILRQRLRSERAVAAAAPKLARFAPRLRAAQTMLALGLTREAAALLRIAMQDDPARAGDPSSMALAAIAGWMIGQPAGDVLDNPALHGSDEITLWRALSSATPPPPAAPGAPVAPAASIVSAASVAEHLAATWKLLLAYPEPLRHRLLPRAADLLARGRQTAALQDLLARLADASLDPARATLLRAQGKADEALRIYARLAAGSDRKRSAEAVREAVELRFAAGRLKPAEAADELMKHLYAWRDDDIELATRLRVSALRAQSGQWRESLAGLREADGLYPAAHADIRAAQLQVITDLLHAGQAARLAPLDLVALMEESAGLLAEKDASATLAPVLVEKLIALDLPDRATPILARLMAQTEEPVAKAELGLRLAAQHLDQSNPPEALRALASSAADGLPGGLPEGLTTRRAVMQARALAESGDITHALALLSTQAGAAAWTLQARLLEQRHDWRGAETALALLSAASLPASGALTDAEQDLVLRLAGAASQAADAPALRRLQATYAPRVTSKSRTDLLAVLTQSPVRLLADLPRSAREVAAVRAVPAALASFELH